MHQRIAFCLAVLIGLTANAQTVNLGGIVSNSSGQPVANAYVTLVRKGMKDTTGTDGKYSFVSTVAVRLPAIVPQTEEIAIDRGVLQFTLKNSSPVKIEIYDVKGNLLQKESLQNAAAGVYRFDIAKNCRATNLLVIKAAIGNRDVSFPYMTLHSGKYTLNPSNTTAFTKGGELAALSAVLDTLKITATGFQAKTMTITSYTNQQQNISLDSSSGKNPPGPSVGCGKTLGSINKSGTYTITSSGTNRTYIINIPTNYDKDTPYRLIFGMHCMGGSAARVAAADNGDDLSAFYSLKTQADKDNIQCIYVAPQGNSDGTWNGDADHKFFSDMVNLFKTSFCIDTTRIFSAGFSFGAMFTYSLSLEFQKTLRAVACYAPANYNIWLPTNAHLPIGYFQTTGTTDGMCPWDNGGRGGKYCLQGHIQDNGCTVPSSYTLATSNKHVTTEFSGCNNGYPVKFSSFQGGHQCMSSDQGSTTNWIEVETWEFFKRF
jgi:poly(3-hydroxybutyrate) depolymerase